ncbi:MAG: HEAT repeat domain-containing protein [Armatimonadota bacterium]|nr:HEAT repeat domain-containing protein [Armatimonadota bacterium]
MNLASTAGIFAANATWRATDFKPAGRVLIRALGSTDENQRDIAGMFLVQAGRQAEPLLYEALARRENVPIVLTILGDIGDPQAEPTLRQFTTDPDPAIARAAHDALRVFAVQRKMPPPSPDANQAVP